ncbi:hypothetical protein ACQY0O_001295 [Thecaphora frezii]
MSAVQDDISGTLHDLLSSVIPYPIFRIIAAFSNLIYNLLGSSNDPTSWTSTLLPPLLTFFLAYTALVIAYRTVRNTIALAWWGIKWGAIIGAVMAIWAWWTDNTDALHSVGQAPPAGVFDQLGRFTTLIDNSVVSALYSQFAGGAGVGAGSRARQSTPYASRERKPTWQQQQRQRHRRNGRAGSSTDFDDFLPGDLGSGVDAFTELLRRAQQGGNGVGGVDFAGLLTSMIAAGQRQGIDAVSALRAAGRVQDEVKRFQENPTAWIESVGTRFRTSGNEDNEPIGSRTRARRSRGRGGA